MSSPDTRAQAIYSYLHPTGPGGNGPVRSFHGLFDFAVHCRTVGMTSDDIAKIVNDVSTTNLTYLRGRVNVNTASASVLTAAL